MSNELHRLIYYSKNQMPGDQDEMIEGMHQILSTSRINNARAGVTGALLFNGGCFAQVLEGTAQAISETFERIQCDPRHGDVLVLEFAPADNRSFANWSMAFIGQDQKDKAIFGEISNQSQFDPSRLTAEQMFDTLHRLLLEEERSAAAAA